jgi:2'-5' RNA ligase
MYRIFTALDIPDTLKSRLLMLQGGIPGARWMENDQMHLTLEFIGDVDGAMLDDIVGVLHTIRSPGFELFLEGIGHFPPRKDPRVLWVGVRNNEFLDRLHKKIRSALTRSRLPSESRKFHPHVTLARLKNPSSAKLAAFMAYRGTFCSEAFAVREFVLYRSLLSPKGACYERLADFPLDPVDAPGPFPGAAGSASP